MPARWTAQKEKEKYQELLDLYANQNKTISEIGAILSVAPNTVYDRLIRLKIPIQTEQKPGYNNARVIDVPPRSGDLAEFCGIMLGDGHIGPAQIFITVNIKTDSAYVPYLQDLLERLFHFRPRVTAVKSRSVADVYVTSAHLVRQLRGIGLYSSNKVRDQVGVPDWIFSALEYQRRFLRGFFDTDGSIYQLKHFEAVQMSFSNRSLPLLEGTRQLLLNLRYRPSRVSDHSVYLTRRKDIKTYIQEIGFGNAKHAERAQRFGALK